MTPQRERDRTREKVSHPSVICWASGKVCDIDCDCDCVISVTVSCDAGNRVNVRPEGATVTSDSAFSSCDAGNRVNVRPGGATVTSDSTFS